MKINLGISPKHKAAAADIQRRLEPLMMNVEISVEAEQLDFIIGYRVTAISTQSDAGAYEFVTDGAWQAADTDILLALVANRLARYLGKATFLADRPTSPS